MTDLRARVDALEALLASERGKASAEPLAVAILDLCEELLPAGQASTALDLLEQVNGRRNALQAETILKLDIARVAMLLGAYQYGAAFDSVRKTVAESEDLLRRQPRLADRLQVLHGACLWATNHQVEAVAVLMQVRKRLLTEPDSALLAQCGIHLSCAHWALGEHNMASHLALDALVAARRVHDRYLESVALINYATNMRRACRWAEAASASEEALELLEAFGNRHQANNAMRGLALLNWKRGRLEAALQLANQCARDADEQHNPMLQSYGRLTRTVVLIHLGRFKEAVASATDLPPWGTAAESRAAVLASQYLADIELEQGNTVRALEGYEEVYAKSLAVAPKGDIVGDVYCRRAECYRLMGRNQEAYAEATAALTHWRALGDRYEEAATHRSLALSAALVGRPDEAKQWFDEGFAYYDDIQTPYEWGKLWMAYGDWLLSPHAGVYASCQGALGAYLAALDNFERIGAEAKLRQVNERLEKLASAEAPEAAMATSAVRGAVRRGPRCQRRTLELDRRSAWAFETFQLVTRSPSMLALLDDVAKLAQSDTPMLVLGESGTGKELVARGIHWLSGRKGTFMAINAGSLPREIIESELFGHVAGSFTGATRDKVGIFEVCNKGTVFLDEIAEMSTELQSRLLRFLETGESRRVGANANIAVDTRIIAATNRERRDLERGKGFRVDLYYRLAHAVVALPPLRQRGEDVRLLVEYFLAEACAAAGRRVELSPAAMRSLVSYAWPGNVRQLRAVIKRVVLLAKEGRAVASEELELYSAEVPTTLTGELQVEERRLVREALTRAAGSRAEAARILGLPRTTLVNKIRRFGL